jgi:soluble epoxide hydrolase/lipid-phosphate phosphatase
MCLHHPERVLAVGAVCTAYTPPAKRYLPMDVVVAKVPYFAYQKLLADAANTGKMLDAAPRRFLTAVFRKHSEMSPSLEDGKTPIVGTLQGVSSSTDPIFTQRSAMLSEAELQYYVDQYTHAKFQSSCQYYATREIDFNDEQGLSPIISHKALFIAAANDHVLKPELARKMSRFLPNLETHVVDDAGHWVLWEQKERVNALLEAWLAEIPAPGADRSKL